jgi:hypothetical protein
VQLKGAGEPARQRKKRQSDKIHNHWLDLLISATGIIVSSHL